MSQEKPIIMQWYEVIMEEEGGPTGPFTKAIVDAVEGKDSQKDSTKDKKVIIQFKKNNF